VHLRAEEIVLRRRVAFPVVAVLAAVSGLPAPGVAQPAVPARAAATVDDRPLIASIQELLTTLGYETGPADGMMGQRTRRAIVAFQRKAKLPADGQPSEALYRHLTQALNHGAGGRPTASATPSAASARPTAAAAAALAAIAPAAGTAVPPGPDRVRDVAPPIEHVLVHGVRWRITDSNGAAFDLLLEAGGHVAGTAMARFWHWERTGDTIRLTFDNEWGGRVVRTGQVAGDRIAGTAEGGGRKWSWHAERVPTGPDRAAWSGNP